MKLSWKTKMYLIIIPIAIFIAFPFFEIEYFDTFQFNLIIYHYLLIPILIFGLISTYFLQFNIFRRIENTMHVKQRTKLQDIISLVFLTIPVLLVVYGLTLSFLIITNACLGNQKTIFVNQPVIEYEAYNNKAGRLQHYITFKSPTDGALIRLNTNRKYKIGEVFSKEMKLGKWGILYSFD